MCDTNTSVRSVIGPQARSIVFNVINYFEKEKLCKRYMHTVEKVGRRAAEATRLSLGTIANIKKEGKEIGFPSIADAAVIIQPLSEFDNSDEQDLTDDTTEGDSDTKTAQELTNVCGACLTPDTVRQTAPIDELASIYYQLIDDNMDSSKPCSSIPLCWECRAALRNCLKFQQMASYAQHMLNLSAEHGVENTNLKPLSTLKVVLKNDYDFQVIHHEDPLISEHRHNIESNSIDTNFEKSLKKSVQTDTEILTNPAKGSIPKLKLQPVKPKGWIHVKEGNTIRKVPIFHDSTTKCLNKMVTDSGKQPLKIIQPFLVNPVTGNIGQPIQTTTGSKTDLSLTGESSEVSRRALKRDKTDLNEETKKQENIHFETIIMTEEAMLSARELDRQKPQYAAAPYKCARCCTGYAKESQLRDHDAAKHTPKPSHQQCPVCDVYQPCGLLNKHLRSHYVLFQCRSCGFAHRRARNIWTHIAKHERFESKCDICDKTYKTSFGLSQHKRREHSVLARQAKDVICEFCEKSFKNYSSLKMHLNVRHGNRDKVPCPLCNKLYIGEFNLGVHMRNYHQPDDKPRKVYRCEPCNKTFASSMAYRTHMKLGKAHCDPATYKFPCPACAKRFPNRVLLNNHHNFYHLGRSDYNCDICGKMLASRRCLQQHMLYVHEGAKRVRDKVCEQCGKAFAEGSALRSHKATHSDARSYVCRACGATFKQNAALYTHYKRRHLGIRPVKKARVVASSTDDNYILS